MNSTICSANIGSRVTTTFDGITVNTLATSRPGAMEGAVKPSMDDGRGMGTTS